VATRLTSPLFAQLIESRDAQFGATAGVRYAEGSCCASPRASRTCSRRSRRSAACDGALRVNIGIVCYASVGGSGVVATELAGALAERGHDVHILSTEPPFRLREQPGLTLHRVETPAYPLFREPQYVLSLANKIVQVARDRELDVVHAHYAIPHAAAAYLARQVLADGGHHVPSIVTTLHGTDITIVGSDPTYRETVAYCIDRSDGVTAVSESLKADTMRALGVAARSR
jgi:L-malate glycosyltransferase